MGLQMYRPVPTRRGSDRFRVYIEEEDGRSEEENATPTDASVPPPASASVDIPEADLKSPLSSAKQPVITIIARSDSASSCFLRLSNVVGSPPAQAVM